MAIKIFANLDWVGSSSNLDFIRFHSFLNQSSNITKSNVDTSLFDSCVGCILDSF